MLEKEIACEAIKRELDYRSLKFDGIYESYRQVNISLNEKTSGKELTKSKCYLISGARSNII